MRIIFLLIVHLVLINGLLGQTHDPEFTTLLNGKQIEDSLQVRKQQALDAVIREIERSGQYPSLGDRVIFCTQAADLIWETDIQLAKKILKESFILAKEAEVHPLKDENKSSQLIRTDTFRRELRSEILIVALKKDVTLLKDLIDLLDKENEDQLLKLRASPSVFGSTSFNKRQIAMFASVLAKTDPKAAVYYAKASLGYGIPQELHSVFRELAISSPEHGRELFKAATDHFLSDNSNNLYDALILSGYLRLVSVSDEDKTIAQRLLSGGLIREQRVLQAVREGRLNESNLYEVVFLTSKNLYQLFENFYPEKLSDIDVFIRQLAHDLGKPTEFGEEKVQESKGISDPEYLISRAEKETNEENKNAFYMEAALAYARKREFEKALNTLSKSSDKVKGALIEDHIRREHVFYLVDQNELSQASKIIEKIVAPELYAETVLTIVKKERESDILNSERFTLVNAQRTLEKGFADASNARAYLWLASEYTLVDPELGIELLSSAIKRANQAKDLVTINSAPKLIQLGGLSNQAIYIGNSTGDFMNGFAALAVDDLLLTMSISELFENRFFRGMAIIASAKRMVQFVEREERSKKVR